MKKLRRCNEDRFDFTEKDATFFPMSINQGGQTYGFCPAKATWDSEAISLYNTLVVSLKYGKLFTDNNLIDQPAFLIDLMSWFASVFEQTEWASRMRAIFGGDDNKAKKPIRKNKVR